MDWNDVRYFLALARLGSIRAAGSSLGVSHSTVVRRVEALEEQLEVRLFDRSREGYALTSAGQQMVPGAERVEDEMSALERGLLGQDGRLEGTVCLTSCDNYVSGILMKELRYFCEEFPDIELSFNTDSRPFDLAKREADIAIRALGREASLPEFLIGQRLAPITVANYVAREHAARLDPDAPGTQARWIAFERSKLMDSMVAGTSYPGLPSWGAFNSLELMVQATREGLGLVMLPTYVGDTESDLVRMPQPDLRHVADLWLLCHPDLRDNARFRATRKRIVNAFKKRTALFRGTGPSDAPS